MSTRSSSRFAALAVDAGESSDTDSDSRAPPPPPALSSSAGAASATSKKAAARKRAQLRKKGSLAALDTPEDSDSSPAARSIPPLPALPASASASANGVPAPSKPVAKVVPAPAVPRRDEPTVAKATPAPPAPAPVDVAPPVGDDDSDSDAETQPDGYDDDDVSTEDEADGTLPVPLSPGSPVLSSPRLPSPKPEAYTGADHDPNKKLKAIVTRTIFGALMVSSLVGIVALGHVYVIILVFVCQALVFAELTALFDAGYSSGHPAEEAVTYRSKEREERRRDRREQRDRWSRRMSWYFFAATNYFLYGESLIYYFKHILTLQATFLPTAFSFAQHHRLISFGLYVIGFVSFVANLTRNQLRRQFGLFGWIHMSLLLIVVSSHFIVNNILEGLIWFWQPVSLVIMNDIAAYVCGMLFGRHQLIKLSPKKTVEGFVGAFFVTIIFAVGWGTLFMRFDYFICPVKDLATNVFSDMHCVPNSVFVWRDFLLPGWAQSAVATVTGLTVTSIPWAPFQLHSIVMAIFASLVAPFGGFFASGFKRAFNIKDFGDSIPGHGGMTDRMDCQFLMGLFSYVYYASLIRETHVTVASVLATIVSSLRTEEQLELLAELSKLVAQNGIKAAVPW